ncbi:unnamed protein product [Cuscuta campestris]|uniref:Uncharacterized protein n=1 Tax=Cuscuta campestris TaxID=132261 RepID=A0A484MXN7_9ASTE|nr:unnamed protein product [Cuscuta campestris]
MCSELQSGLNGVGLPALELEGWGCRRCYALDGEEGRGIGVVRILSLVEVEVREGRFGNFGKEGGRGKE